MDQNSSKLDWRFVDVKQAAIKNVIVSRLNESLETVLVKYAVDPYKEEYAEIRDVSRELGDLTANYLEAVKTLTMSLSEYYTNTGVNLAALVEVSNAIRNEAIEPSFAMLQEQDTKLKGLRQNLAEFEIMTSE